MAKGTQINAQQFKIEKVEEEKKKNKAPPANAIRVIAYDGDIGGFRELAEFYAYRYENQYDKTTYIKNDTLDFMIPMPDSERENNNLDLLSLLDRLIAVKEKIEQELIVDNPRINQLDLLDEKKQLEKELRILLYSKNSGYWFMDKKGTPCLKVWRKGNTWHPLKFDLSSDTIYTPSNTRLADTRNAESNKRIKYGSLTSLTTIGIIFIVTSFLMMGSGVWVWYKAFETLEASSNVQAMGDLLNQCTEGIKENQEEVKKGVIDGVADAIINNQVNSRPVGSGG